MSKAVLSQLVSRYKTKGTVETEIISGQLKKSTPHTVCKIIRYVKKKPFASARYNLQIGT